MALQPVEEKVSCFRSDSFLDNFWQIFLHIPYFGNLDQGVRLKGIGKVAIKGTKQIGRTLTAISDSPDKRVQRKVNEAQYNQREKRKQKTKRRRSITVSDESLGFDDTGVEGMSSADGKVHSVESVMLSSSDIASSTTVVDSIGQKLTLKIDNVQGGGGQRRISIFCPFWIVNNTEHSLVYRYVSLRSSGQVLCLIETTPIIQPFWLSFFQFSSSVSLSPPQTRQSQVICLWHSGQSRRRWVAACGW